MPPAKKVSEADVEERVRWLLSCGIRKDVIHANRLDTPMLEEAFKQAVAEVLRTKALRAQTKANHRNEA